MLLVFEVVLSGRHKPVVDIVDEQQVRDSGINEHVSVICLVVFIMPIARDVKPRILIRPYL